MDLPLSPVKGGCRDGPPFPRPERCLEPRHGPPAARPALVDLFGSADVRRHDHAVDGVHDAARDLQFELAARLRDEVNELEKEVTPTSVRVSPSGW